MFFSEVREHKISSRDQCFISSISDMSHRFKEFASLFEVSFSGEVYLIPNENDKIKVEYIFNHQKLKNWKARRKDWEIYVALTRTESLSR